MVLKELARELNLEPRTLRIRLRKLAKAGKFKHGHKQRWQWNEEEVKHIKELLNEHTGKQPASNKKSPEPSKKPSQPTLVKSNNPTKAPVPPKKAAAG